MPLADGTNPGLSPGARHLLLAAFFALGLIQILHHPLWQDEWQAWLIARESHSLAGLFHNFRYDGHPGLWYLALFGLSRLTGQPLAMQLFHLALATASVYVFLRFSPFTRLQKILFCFGYFPFFEYAVISRNYAAGVLLIFTYCAVFPRSFAGKYLVLASLLFLLCQTSVYGLLLALALAAALFYGEFTNNRANFPKLKYQLAAATVILGAGVLISVLQLKPPPDSGFAVDWRFYADWPAARRSVSIIWESLVPLPSLQVHFWNTNLLGNQYLKFFLSVLLLAFSLWLFQHRPAALVLWALGTLALLSFTYIKYLGSLRHHGHLFILLMAAAWLAAAEPAGPERSGDFQGNAAFCPPWGNGFLALILAAQLTAGLLAAGLALYTPFSAGQETAQYLQAHDLDRLLIAADEDDAASVVSGYLNRPLYYLCAHRWGTFVIWDNQRNSLEVPEVLARARDLATRQRREVLLLLNREIKTPEPGIIPVWQFPRSIVPAEAFYLYLIQGTGAPPGP